MQGRSAGAPDLRQGTAPGSLPATIVSAKGMDGGGGAMPWLPAPAQKVQFQLAPAGGHPICRYLCELVRAM